MERRPDEQGRVGAGGFVVGIALCAKTSLKKKKSLLGVPGWLS